MTSTGTDPCNQSLTIELSDGFSVFFPSGALASDCDASTIVTCNVDITVTPFTANKRPASFYAYTVSCQDENGSPIVQLNSNATFTVPVNQTQVENVGATMDAIDMCYFDTSTGAYSSVDSYTVDDTNDVITYQQNHLTDFAVVTNGNLAGIAGEEAGSGANEYAEETGDDSGGTEAAAAASGGCGCNVAANPPMAEKLLIPFVLIGLFGSMYIMRLAVKKARRK